MSLERIILVISLALNLFLLIFAFAIWPERLLPTGIFFYRPILKEEPSLLNTGPPAISSSLLANVSQSLFLNSQVESFRPIRNWSVALPPINAQASSVYLLDSQRILAADQPDLVLPIASLTKIMSATIALEQMPIERQVVMVQNFLNQETPSQFIDGEVLTVENLLYLMLIASSNEAATALAHNLETSKPAEDFIVLMNQKAQLLGMSQTNFADAAGLSPGNISTVNDLLKLVDYTLKQHPLIWQILSLAKAELTSVDKKITHQIASTNQLWGSLSTLIAGKTGYTDEAGGCLLIISQAPNHLGKIVSIILGSPDRFGQMKTLLQNIEKAYLW